MMQIATPFVLWLMGPTSSGKTTIAAALHARLRARGVALLHFDGDEFRDLFGSGLDFSEESRLRVVKAIVHLAASAASSGVSVVVSALTARQNARDLLSSGLPEAVVGYVRCAIDTCVRRDPKGLYALARAGKIDTLVGYNEQYPPPERYDMLIDTDTCGVAEAVERILGHLTDRGFLVRD